MLGRKVIRVCFGACLALSSLVGAALAGAQSAGADSTWATNTLFVAANGNYGDYEDGSVIAISPSGEQQTLYYGEAYDVTVDATGDVFWADCTSGDVYEYVEGIGTETLLTGFDCPTGIAYDASDNSLLIGSFSNGMTSYDLSDMVATTLISRDGGIAQSIAVDNEGDVYFSNGNELFFMPASTPGTFYSVPDSDEASSVRLDASGDLYTSTASQAQVAELVPGSDSVTTIGTPDFGDEDYSTGATIDSSGNVYESAGSYYGKVFEIAAGTGDETTVASYVDGPDGLATWPPVTAAGRAASSVGLETSSPSTVYAGTAESFTATVSSGGDEAVGYVQFECNGSEFGSPVPLSGGTATIDQPLPNPGTGSDGTDDITAFYLGNSGSDPAVSDGASIGVDWYGDTVTLTGPATVPQDKRASFKVKVQGSDGQGVPTGSVELTSGGDDVGYATLNAMGSAHVKVNLEPGGSSLQAIYYPDGDTPYLDGESNSLDVDAVAPFTTDMDSYSDTGVTAHHHSTPVIITVDLDRVGSEPSPSGTVSVLHKTGWTCTALSDEGSYSTATCSGAVSGYGNKYRTIDYSGDVNYGAARTQAEIYIRGGGCGDDC